MVSELEKQRQKNIARNEALLREFNLKELSDATFADSQPATKPKSKPKTSRRKRDRTPPQEPIRKSRRLRGIKLEEEHEAKRTPEELEKEAKTKEKEKLKQELDLQEVVNKGDWDRAMDIVNSFNADSLADMFDVVKPTDNQLKKLRKEFASLSLDPRDISITSDRVESIEFHPSPDKTLIMAGDRSGQVGLWDATKDGDEGVVQFQTHAGKISRLWFYDSKIYTCSYDGSIRITDFTKQKSTEVFALDGSIGISDFAIINSNTVYYSTLEGSVGIVDIRTKNATASFELSEKKIGGFSVNPRQEHEIATGSLDKTMRVWDIRAGESKQLGEYESRLSISCTSWNASGQIVCNGYDDTINVFNTVSEKMTPDIRIKHNCHSGRWIPILKSIWQQNPEDGIQKFAIANMKRPIDVFSGTGQPIAHLSGDIFTAIPAVVNLHRQKNWVVGGTASGKVYLFT